MHPNNPYLAPYPFDALIKRVPKLKEDVYTTPKGQTSINFADAQAVKRLNQALLAHYHKVTFWDIPDTFLCPPIPGRLDYLLHLNDVLGQPKHAKVLDVGTGGSLIYPILGKRHLGWDFVASDVDSHSLKHAQLLNEANQLKVSLRKQTSPKNILTGIIKHEDTFDAVMCNPPFHESMDAMQAGVSRKWQNLKGKKSGALNFKGRSNELVYPGGELAFINTMIDESVAFKANVSWFTSLVSQGKNIVPLTKRAKALGAHVKTIEMAQGNKISRFIAWRF